MDTLEKKYDSLSSAIAHFGQALRLFDQWQNKINPEMVKPLKIGYQDIRLNLFDSSIRRFKYSIDLLWKYIKSYLDLKLRIVPDIASPNTIIREACRARLLTEEEINIVLEMIKNRNMTSHIYQEEIAALLLEYLPKYAEIMQVILNKINPTKMYT